jgi:hypothetical protein
MTKKEVINLKKALDPKKAKKKQKFKHTFIIYTIIVLIIIALIFIALGGEKQIKDKSNQGVDYGTKNQTSDQEDTTPDTKEQELEDELTNDESQGGSSGGSNGGGSGDSGTQAASAEVCDDNLDNDLDGYKDCSDSECMINGECDINYPACANWFGSNTDWDTVTVASEIGNAGVWGLMNGNICTEEKIKDQGEYACSIYLEGGSFIACAGDCEDGICLPCDDCEENVSSYGCMDFFDNDGDGYIDCEDPDCYGQENYHGLICCNDGTSAGDSDICPENTDCDGGYYYETYRCMYCLEDEWDYCAEGQTCDDGVCTGEGICSGSDSDEGPDHYTKGTCDDGTDTFTDYCDSQHVLVEYWLSDWPDCECEGATTLYNCNAALGETWTCDDGECVDTSDLCRAYCTGLGDPDYNGGACVSYNDQGALSREMTCMNFGGSTYEDGGDEKCLDDFICCCR